MSGGNQIYKFAKVDRNDYLNPLQYIGTPFQLISPIPSPITTATILYSKILQDLLFTAATPNALSFLGPTGVAATAADVGAALSVNSLNQIGERWTMGITNTDAVSKVVTLPAGFIPATITVPPGFSQYTFQVDSVQPEVISLINTTGAAVTAAIGGVTSWNGRVGPVIPLPGDYNSTQITNLSTVAGADVTTALNNLKAQSGVTSFTGAQGSTRTGPIVALSGDYGTDNITNQSTVPGGTDTQALNFLENQYNTATVQSFNGRFGPVIPAAGDYNASQVTFTPSGNCLSTDTTVQLAIDRLATSAYCRTDFSAVVAAGAWTPNPVSAIVRQRGVFSVVAPFSILDSNPADAPFFLSNISILASSVLVVAPGAGSFGARVKRNGIVVASIQVPDDQTGAIQFVSTSCEVLTNTGDLFTVESLNNTGGNTISVSMIIHHILGGQS